METSLVSVIIPTFNSEKYISDTIISVQNQTYQNWEIILVDDGSIDATRTIIITFLTDKRIQFYPLGKNSGTGVARNFGVTKAAGKYIAFLDADDLWKPQKLEKQIDFMQTHDLPFTFSFYEWMDENGKTMGKRIEAPLNLLYRQLFFCNYVGNLTGIYDVDYFGKISISSIRKRQDWMHWLTILKKIKTAKPVPESLAFYRIHTHSLSTSKTELIRYNFAVYRQFHGFNFIVSCFCMIGFLFTQLVIKPFYKKTIK
ncbi:glycosyltransferase family 2 protein [Flavobacterium daejeonense]|uniref:glycosyltransferase family 2 protein n=1 Tax=Flavobacterium daejeonense TaxID=350893 RepID=UPI00047A9C36|nr:glycosyltransferase family 2 protein [Flavobacterium daejeonense]